MQESVLSERVSQELIEKIKKIQALAEKGSMGEAENAAAMLSRLLVKHNLTLADIPKDDARYQGIGYDTMDGHDVGSWRAELMYQLAKHHFCQIIAYNTTDGIKWVLVGKKANQGVVRQMYEWLEEQISRLGSEELIKAQTTIPDTIMDTPTPLSLLGYIRRDRLEEENMHSYTLANEQPIQWANSWRVGAVRGITDRLETERRIIEKEEGKSALVPLQKEVDDYIQENFQVEERKRKINSDLSIYEAGREKGRTIGVHKPVGTDPLEALQ
jgi:hypothetical protein